MEQNKQNKILSMISHIVIITNMCHLTVRYQCLYPFSKTSAELEENTNCGFIKYNEKKMCHKRNHL